MKGQNSEWLIRWKQAFGAFFKGGRKWGTAVWISVAVASFCCIILLIWSPGEKEVSIRFGESSPRQSDRTVNTSAGLLGIASYAEVSVSVGGKLENKLSYKRFLEGDTMYSTCFGLLNIRSSPSREGKVVGRIAYGEEIHAYWKEDSGYIRVSYIKPHSGEIIEGYCLREELSEEQPSDNRVYLNIPDFKQYDERWGSIRLGNSYETIKTAGCTTTCLAMAYSYLEGHVTTPDVMEERLGYNENGELGFPRVYERISPSNYLEVIYEKLKEGIPVLVGAFKDADHPHWVLVIGYEGDGTEFQTSDFLIRDPASEERPTLAEFFIDYPDFNKIAYYRG